MSGRRTCGWLGGRCNLLPASGRQIDPVYLAHSVGLRRAALVFWLPSVTANVLLVVVAHIWSH